LDFTEDAMGILYVWPFIWTPVEAIRRIVWALGTSVWRVTRALSWTR
jgi:hypothetical protein